MLSQVMSGMETDGWGDILGAVGASLTQVLRPGHKQNTQHL